MITKASSYTSTFKHVFLSTLFFNAVFCECARLKILRESNSAETIKLFALLTCVLRQHIQIIWYEMFWEELKVTGSG